VEVKMKGKALMAVALVLMLGVRAWGQGETTTQKPKLSPEETFRLYKQALDAYPYFKSVTFDYQKRAQCEVNLPLLEVDLYKQIGNQVTINATSCTIIIENNKIMLNIRHINNSKTIPLLNGSKGANLIIDSIMKRDARLGALIALLAD
jgi:hypothetical protein